jgi:hypothetical protein
MKTELEEILRSLPKSKEKPQDKVRKNWERWRKGLKVKISIPEELPPLKMLLVMDNLVGHKTPEFVVWLFCMGWKKSREARKATPRKDSSRW